MPPKTVSEWLGHAHISTTLALYTQSFDAGKREAAERLNGLLTRLPLSDALSNPRDEAADQEGTNRR